MWPYLEYFDRKINTHQVHSVFWTMNNILARRQFFFGIFEQVWIWLCAFEKYFTDLRGNVLEYSVRQKGTKCANSKTNSVLCLLGIDSSVWGTNMTINEVHFSQNISNLMRAHQPCCQKRCLWRLWHVVVPSSVSFSYIEGSFDWLNESRPSGIDDLLIFAGLLLRPELKFFGTPPNTAHCHLTSNSNLNLICLCSKERGKRNLKNKIID